MKRTIKIRAWGRYGDWNEEADNREFIMIDSESLCFIEFEPLEYLLDDREDVEYFMLYVGINAKNGDNLYEGDIIKYRTKNIIKSLFQDDPYTEHISVVPKITDYSVLAHINKYAEDIEIIGNIHQTPHLMP